MDNLWHHHSPSHYSWSDVQKSSVYSDHHKKNTHSLHLLSTDYARHVTSPNPPHSSSVIISGMRKPKAREVRSPGLKVSQRVGSCPRVGTWTVELHHPNLSQSKIKRVLWVGVQRVAQQCECLWTVCPLKNGESGEFYMMCMLPQFFKEGKMARPVFKSCEIRGPAHQGLSTGLAPRSPSSMEVLLIILLVVSAVCLPGGHPR